MNEDTLKLALFQTVLPYSDTVAEAAGIVLDVLNVLWPDFPKPVEAVEVPF